MQASFAPRWHRACQFNKHCRTEPGIHDVRITLGRPRRNMVRSPTLMHRIGAARPLLQIKKFYNYLFLNKFASGTVPAECVSQFYCTYANTLKGKNMFKKTIIAGLVAGAFAPALAFAQAAPAPTPEHTLTGNMGIYSQYVFRGLTQTDGDPALQGGFDYSHSSGLYAGVWMSNVSWLRDFGAYNGGGSLEMDFYGGYKGTFGGDFGYDVGLLQYYYPGSVTPGFVKADTLELYGALSWKWLSAKYSYSLNDKTFGVTDSRGTYYFDLTANFPVNDKLSLLAHYGIQKFDGSTAAGVSNDSFASYDDYKLGISYVLPQNFTIGAFYTDTSMDATQELFYTALNGRKIGKDTFTVYLSKTF
jgi:uncharacterized protein (TIGR02001 family)